MVPIVIAAAAGGLLAAGAAGSFIGAKILFNRVIPRQDSVRVDISEMADAEKWKVYIEEIHRVKALLLERGSEHVTIKSRDGLALHANVYPAEQPANRTAVLFHGYTSNGFNDCSNMGEYFAERGYNVIIVDNRAHGESEGKYIGFGILDRFDCVRWLEYANERFGDHTELVLYGVSMGGSTVLMAAGTEGFPKNVKAVIADCAFTAPYDVFKHILRRDYHLPPHPIMDINDRMCRRKAGYGFRDYSTLTSVRKGACPILFIHGKDDLFVPAYMSRLNYEACTGEKELLMMDNAGHAAAQYENPALYKETCDRFLEKYL